MFTYIVLLSLFVMSLDLKRKDRQKKKLKWVILQVKEES